MLLIFFFKQKTAYEMRISDWSSDVCSSDLLVYLYTPIHSRPVARGAIASIQDGFVVGRWISVEKALHRIVANILAAFGKCPERIVALHAASGDFAFGHAQKHGLVDLPVNQTLLAERSEEHTSELQYLMRHSYAVFCLKKNNQNIQHSKKTK